MEILCSSKRKWEWILCIMLEPISIDGAIDEAAIEQAEQVGTLHTSVKHQVYNRSFLTYLHGNSN